MLKSRLAPLLTPAIAIVGFLLSLALGAWLQAIHNTDARELFERHADRVEDEIKRRLGMPLYGLNGLRGMHQAMEPVSRAEFRAWVLARDMDLEFPGVRGFGRIERVLPAERETWLEKVRADGAPGFAVRQLSEGIDGPSYVIRLIEPVERNGPAVGLDVGSEPRRRAAIERAIETGAPTLTRPVPLVQDGRQTPGFLLYVPLYKGEQAPKDGVERRRMLRAVLYSPIVAREILAGATRVADDRVDFVLQTQVGKGAPEQVFESRPAELLAQASASPPSRTARAQPLFRLERRFEIHALPFVLQVSSTPQLEQSIDRTTPGLVTLGGLLLTFALAWLASLSARERQRAERQVASMTQELDRLAAVARYTQNAVVITGLDRRTVWVNEGFVRLTGYSAAEALGRSPGQLLQCPATDLREVARLRAALEAGEPFRGELVNRSKSGRDYWVEIEIEALRDAAGAVTGYMAIESDVTERKAMLQQLTQTRAEAARLAMVARRTSNAVAITDRQLRIEWVNEAFTALYGHGLEQAAGRSLHELLAGPNTEAEPLAALRAAVESGAACRVELINRAVDGRDVWVDVEMQPRFDASGQVDGFIEVHSDISARRLAEAEARRAAELLRNAVEALDEGFVLFDADDRMVMCNARHRELYPHVADLLVPGARFEDIARRSAERGAHPDAIGRVDAWLRERMAMRHEGNTVSIQRLTSGRTLRIVERRLADGHTVGVRIDITELERARQQAEAARKEASDALARLQAIYDILPVGIAITDPQGQIIDCNPASERLLGISKAEHLARRHDSPEWTVLREDGSPMPPEELASVRALRERRPVHDALLQVVTPQRSVWLSVSAMPAEHPGLGVVIGYVDVSEMRAQQAALIEAKAAAEQASVAKSQFLANMSHEIRTPMNAILGMLTLLQRTQLNGRQADYAAKTESAARSLLGLLNDILDFSKIEAGKMALDPHPFRLERLMGDLGVILSASVGSKPIDLLFDLDPRLPSSLLGDALRLQQVLINLGGNALKFTEQGEVVVSVRHLEDDASGVRLRFAVRDTGIGIAPQDQARIFAGFTQAQASTTRRFGGTGLGLAISKWLVEMMGGQLGLESELGRGTCFFFELFLPYAESPEEAPMPAAAGALRVLVVDDNATACALLQQQCESLGWAADVVQDGTQAVHRVADAQREGRAYDVLLVDCQMPGQDGFETIASIDAAGQRGASTTVLMVTAQGREQLEQRRQADQALLDAYLVKPLTPSMLFDAVINARSGRGHLPLSGHSALQGRRRLEGLRLLLVEDNLNNQQVACELLGDEGAQVRVAGNGAEAVDALAASAAAFDLVLMDLQMPVMDGFTATSRIRQDLDLPTLPIVAMTANAMASDREACLAAGMNDHVGKPFDIDQLVSVIRRHCGLEAMADGSAVAVDAAALLPASVSALAADAGIDLESALRRMGGKAAVLQRLLAGFLDDVERLIATATSAISERRHGEAATALHTLKGLAATVGMAPFAATAAAAEMAARQHQGERGLEESLPLDAQLKALADAWAHNREALHELLRVWSAETAAPAPTATAALDAPVLRRDLEAMLPLLANADMEALDALQALVEQHPGAAGPQLDALDAAVNQLDFDAAQAVVERWLKELP